MTGIIFDMDGTLWDSSAGVAAAWSGVLERHPEVKRNAVTQADVRHVMGLTMTRIAEILFPDLAEDPAHRAIVMKECTDAENDYLRLHGGRLYSGLELVLQELRASQFPLFIESNCQKGYIDAFLDYYGFRRYFSDYLCFGDNGRDKGDNIRLLAERNLLNPYYYVGDIQADYDATMKAGGRFIHAAYGMGSVREKVPELADIRDLPDMIKAQK